MEGSRKILVTVAAPVDFKAFNARMETPLDEAHYDLVQTIESYEQLVSRYDYEIMVVLYGGAFIAQVLNDQAKNSKCLKWVHSMSAGIDGYVAAKDFAASNITLTNVKGAFSAVLGEFVALGMLYHAKKIPSFLSKQKEAKWSQEPVELVSNKTMLIVGFGDIGAACGKIAKAFGTKVIGLKRRPDQIEDAQKQCADEIHGMEKLDQHLSYADFVVGVLPKTAETHYFFNADFFNKMKPSAVFMNIGRGPTVKEVDLISSLEQKKIAGAVLDVFEVEPLAQTSPLWSMSNVLMTPHCADQDPEYLNRAWKIFIQNLQNYKQGLPLVNQCDKLSGY